MMRSCKRGGGETGPKMIKEDDKISLLKDLLRKKKRFWRNNR